MTQFIPNSNEVSDVAAYSATANGLEPPSIVGERWPDDHDEYLKFSEKNKAMIVWVAPPNASNIVAYVVTRKPVYGFGPATTEVETITKKIAAPTLSWIDDDRDWAVDYEYRVSSVDRNGNISEPSKMRVITPGKMNGAEKLYGEVYIKAKEVTTNAVTITWSTSNTLSFDLFLKYEIFRVTDNFQYAAAVIENRNASGDLNDYTWTDNDVLPNTSYKYMMRAYTRGPIIPLSPGYPRPRSRGHQFSKYSNVLEVHTPEETFTHPLPPTTLLAKDVTDKSLTLSWAAPSRSSPITSYRIFRNGATIIDVRANNLSWTDHAVSQDKTYSYFICSVDESGQFSSPSEAVEIHIPGPDKEEIALSAPTNFVANAVTQNAVTLTWAAPAQSAPFVAYRIFRDGEISFDIAVTKKTWTDLQVSAGTSYSYFICTVGADEHLSGPSSVVDVHTPAIEQEDTPPDPPIHLHSTGHTDNSISLQWGKSVGDAPISHYFIFRDDVEIDRISGSVTSYVDLGLASDTEHRYFVVALDQQNRQSEPSNHIQIRTKPKAHEGEGQHRVWEVRGHYARGEIVSHNGRLWRCLQPHIAFEESWAPDLPDGHALWKLATAEVIKQNTPASSVVLR